MASYPANEGLQVDKVWRPEPTNPASEGLQVNNVWHPEPSNPPESESSRTEQEPKYYVEPKYEEFQTTKPLSTIFGLRKRTFWIILGGVAVVAAVAGGVGGGLASKNKSAENQRY